MGADRADLQDAPPHNTLATPIVNRDMFQGCEYKAPFSISSIPHLLHLAEEAYFGVVV